MAEESSSFVLCLSNADFQASLEPRKIYKAIRDTEAQANGLLRIVDETGEDYLYPESLFVPIEVPESAQGALLGAG